MEVTETFKEKIAQLWSNPSRAKAVAEEAMNELFRHGEALSLDHDDQVDYALKIGILAGQCEGEETPERFIREFEQNILSE
jgi:hypothetical protein